MWHCLYYPSRIFSSQFCCLNSIFCASGNDISIYFYVFMLQYSLWWLVPTSHLFVFFSVPEPVGDINVTVSGLTSLIVYWTYPSDSEYTEAKVTCNTTHSDKSHCDEKTVTKDKKNAHYDGLIHGVEYKFTVTVLSNGLPSLPSPQESKTLGNT